MSRTYRVLLVEDDAQTRQRLVAAIEASPGLQVCAHAGNMAEARRHLSHSQPDVLLADLGLPDGSGADLIREAAAAHPALHIMVITVFGDEAHVVEAIEAGATGYLLKDASARQVGSAIAALLAGGSPISPAVARHLLKRFQPALPAAPAPHTALSEREIDVLRLIARGDSYGEIAAALGISVNTVATYTKQIYRKLAVNSRGKAVFEAQQQGLLDS